MRAATYSDPAWRAPSARGPLDAVVRLPGSKSLTNRELVLSALADGPSVLHRRLHARDTDLMVAALVALGTKVDEDGDRLQLTPAPLVGDTAIDCGLAGTLMRFLPPVAALAAGPVRFDGDPQARSRPMATTIGALRDLGVVVDDGGSGRLPFTVEGTGSPAGGQVTLDASGSSQFVSGLLLAGARFGAGVTLQHDGGALPSLPHIAMSVAVLQQRGVVVEAHPGTGRWRVGPQAIGGRELDIEPDLSNAAPFLAAALVAGGRVTVPGWPAVTTQVGDRLREWLGAFGADVRIDGGALTVDGGGGALHGTALRPVDLDLSAGGELAPTLVGLAALADGTSTFTGIGHLRGHETDRLAALTTELGAIGIAVQQTEDGLVVHGGRPAAGDRAWQSYADHRMATTGALLGLATPGLAVDDVATTAKTLPGFVELWTRMLP